MPTHTLVKEASQMRGPSDPWGAIESAPVCQNTTRIILTLSLHTAPRSSWPTLEDRGVRKPKITAQSRLPVRLLIQIGSRQPVHQNKSPLEQKPSRTP